MDLRELKEEYEELKKSQKKIEEELNKLSDEVYIKHRIPELKEQLERAKQEAQREFEERSKVLQDKYKELRHKEAELRQRMDEFNKETWKQFVATVKKYVDEGWLIEQLTIDDDWEGEITREVGDDLYTNFRPEDRVLVEILPTRTSFKYRVLWKSGEKRGQITETRITPKHPFFAEVKLVDKLAPLRVKNKASIHHKGVYTYATASLMCPICHEGYGEIEFDNGEKIIKELPDCPHRDKLVPYGEEQKEITVQWRYIKVGDWYEDPIYIS